MCSDHVPASSVKNDSQCSTVTTMAPSNPSTPPFVRSKSAHLMSSLNRRGGLHSTISPNFSSAGGGFAQQTGNQHRVGYPSALSKVQNCDPQNVNVSPTRFNPKVEGTCQTDDTATGWRRQLKASAKLSSDLGQQHRSRYEYFF